MKLTKIGIALAAMLAMSGLAASAASALTFNSSASPAMLFGEQRPGTKHKFAVDGQNVECNVAEFHKASVNSGVTTVGGVTATYTGCTAFGFSGTVNMGTCTYDFLTPNDSPAIMGKVGLRCNGNLVEEPVRIKSSVFGSECEVTVGETNNTSLSTITYTNYTPNAGELRVDAAVTGIRANKVKDNGLCPLSGTGVVNNATYNGETDVEATGGITITIS